MFRKLSFKSRLEVLVESFERHGAFEPSPLMKSVGVASIFTSATDHQDGTLILIGQDASSANQCQCA